MRWRLPVREAGCDPIGRGLEAFNPVLASVLHQRGIRDWWSAERFLSGVEPLASPWAMLGMERATKRIGQAIRHGELVALFGDYDVDGIASAALMAQTLAALGAQVQSYLPDRSEGHGLNVAALENLCAQGVSLVVTVDCGIRSVAEVEAARRLGLDVIVTDHHEPGPVLPNAVAVLNPKQPGCAYPEKMLAGVGVAHRLAEALLCEHPLPWLAPDGLLDLVALGTIADLAPLGNAENRWLARAGLEHIRTSPRPGIRALLAEAGLYADLIDSAAVSFALAPRLNAAGRLAHANVAYQLLVTTDQAQAYCLAAELSELNQTRQELTARAVALAEAQIDLADNVLVAADASFQAGIIGLAAAKLAERYARPAFVIQLGETISHGSARAGDASFNVVEALQSCTDLLERFGGHQGAAGFSFKTHNLAALQARLRSLPASVVREAELCIDAVVSASDITHENAQALTELQPTGRGNPAAVLCVRDMRLIDAGRFGNENGHLRLNVASDDDEAFEAVGFGMADREVDLAPCLDLAFELSQQFWRGAMRLQLKMRDFRFVGG